MPEGKYQISRLDRHNLIKIKMSKMFKRYTISLSLDNGVQIQSLIK